MMTSTVTRGIAGLMATFAVAYFVLWGCGTSGTILRPPVTMLRPPIPMGQTRNDFGASGSILFQGSNTQLGSLAAWYAHRWGSFEMGGVAFAEQNGIGAGLHFRQMWGSTIRVGLDGEAGLLWAAMGVPVVFDISDHVSLYTRPTAQIGSTGADVFVPAGIGFRLFDDLLAISLDVNVPVYNVAQVQGFNDNGSAIGAFFMGGLSIMIRR